jgi:copper chaperone CopZ
MKDKKITRSCCKPKKEKEGKGFLSGLMYGLIPHTGCIAFIIFTILGVTTATAFFRPLLMSRYFFHGLIVLSFIFATISAIIYLKKHGLLSIKGIKQKTGYLSILYGTSIGINLLLFLFIFPIAANMTGAVVTTQGLPELTLKVDIPCSGHAPLISNTLKELNGVKSVTFRFPDYFDVVYDSKQVTQEKILSVDVFTPYPAIITQGEVKQTIKQNQGCSSCSTCSGTCGGSCGG